MANPPRTCALVLLLICLASLAVSGVADPPPSAILPSAPPMRRLQQANMSCTPARPMSDTKVTFCFQPDTISSEAKAFLASRSSGGTPFDSQSQALRD